MTSFLTPGYVFFNGNTFTTTPTVEIIGPPGPPGPPGPSGSSSGPAGGDLSGSFPNPTVAKLQGRNVANNVPSNGQVLTWVAVNNDWEPATASVSPTGAAGGDLSGNYPNPTVAKINGSSLPAVGTYQIGNVLQANTSSTLTYGAVNLAGGANYVTGILPAANLPNTTTSSLGIIQLSGDLAGTATSPIVVNIHGASVPAAGSLTTGNVLQVSGSSALSYGAINLASANSVTGTLSASNQASQTMGGDVTGTTSSSTVVALRSHAVRSQTLGSAQDGYVLTWVNSNNDWEATAPTGSGGSNPTGPASGDLSGTYPGPTVAKIRGNTVKSQTLGSGQDGFVLTWVNANNDWEAAASGGGPPTGSAGGDLSGSYPSPIVAKINTAVVPAAGALVTGNVLQVNGVSSLTYGAVNLAGGSNFVTGTLPAGNLPNATTSALGIVELAGDLGGTATSVSVLNIHGATVPASGSLTTGNVLQVNGSSSLIYGAINLAGGTNFVTGILPSGNLPIATTSALGIVELTGDIGGNATSVSVLNVHGASVPVAGSLTTGNILQVSGSSSLNYAPLNLGGGANFVTGTLPAANQAAQSMSGNVTGTTASSTVIRINGASLPAAGSLTAGNVLQVAGASALNYGPVNLGGGAGFVTGTLPASNQSPQNMSGDVTGLTINNTVTKLTGNTPINVNPNNAATAAQFTTIGLAVTANMQVGSLTMSLGGGGGVMGITNATANPNSNPSGGGVLYSAHGDGSLAYRGSGGAITTIAPVGTGSVNSQARTKLEFQQVGQTSAIGGGANVSFTISFTNSGLQCKVRALIMIRETTAGSGSPVGTSVAVEAVGSFKNNGDGTLTQLGSTTTISSEIDPGGGIGGVSMSMSTTGTLIELVATITMEAGTYGVGDATGFFTQWIN